jgi:hypothetical protein
MVIGRRIVKSINNIMQESIDTFNDFMITSSVLLAVSAWVSTKLFVTIAGFAGFDRGLVF